MPELPEVETLSRAVEKVVLGKKVTSLDIYRDKLRWDLDKDLLHKALVGSEVIRVFRRSKYMLVELTSGYMAVFHFGMTGNIICEKTAEPKLKHTHLVFGVKKGKKDEFIHFIDPRRFGHVGVVASENWSEDKMFAHLGPEPLECDDLAIHLWTEARNKKRAIKVHLMDASTVVGVGNIYASEALFLSGIRPTRSCSKISRKDYKVIADNIVKVLESSIEQGGTTFRDFKNVDGKPGYFKVHLNVYGREGEECRVCKSHIKAVKQAGRMSFYCPKCQK